MHRPRPPRLAKLALVAGGVTLATMLPAQAADRATPAPARPQISPITNVSGPCAGQNAEVETGVDPAPGYVYDVWMGCKGIGFARSLDGGRHFQPPVSMPGSAGAWDPAVAVASDGTVYVSYMTTRDRYTYPVVVASADHGRSFPRISSLRPPYRHNWGDRDFIAVGPRGEVYLTWDYGPSAAAVTYICTRGGSCAFATGDLNVVIQKSTDGGRTWGPIIPVSPGFPASGGDSAPLLVEPSGRIDLEYQGYDITNDVTYTMKPAHSYFTTSADGGRTWSPPVRIGPGRLTMSLAEWWIDGSIARDAAGNLYVSWDTQSDGGDIGWLAYSTDGGRSWVGPYRVTPDRDDAAHIVEVAGGGRGVAYVGWLTDSPSQGYAQFLRTFSIGRGWLSAPRQVSAALGKRSVWPGDTFGIATLPSDRRTGVGSGQRQVVVSWGSAVDPQRHPRSQIYAAVVG